MASSLIALVLGFAFACAFTNATLADNRQAATNAIERAMQSVVSVLPEWPTKNLRNEEPEGSGVVLGDGSIIATAAHVVAKALSIRVRSYDGLVMRGELIAMDRATDIAVLHINHRLPAIKMASAKTEMAMPVCAIGNAFGLDLSVTCGVVSGVHRSGVGFNDVEDFIQTDASVNPGASGGALVRRNGELVGLLSAIFTKSSDANLGVNFAVSADLLGRVVEELVKTGRVTRVLSGLRLGRSVNRSATGELAARVILVRPASPASRAGLRPGDLILRANGRRIRKPADFRSVMNAQAPPFEVQLIVARDGRRRKFDMAVPQTSGIGGDTQSDGVRQGG